MGDVIRVNWNNFQPPFSTELYRPYNSDNTSLEDISEGIIKQTWLTSGGGYGHSTRLIANYPNVRTDHFYYISYYVNPSFSDSIFGIEFAGGYNFMGDNTFNANEWGQVSATSWGKRNNAGYGYFANRKSGYNPQPGDSCLIKAPIYIDLTQMFGVGNEPNLEEFEAECALNGIDLTQSYPQDDGTERDWIIPHYNQQMMEKKKQMIMAMPHIETITTGNTTNSEHIAHFKTDVPTNIKSLKAYFSPIQEGSGDPSPDNVRPISGWNGLELTRCGVNLLQCDTFSDATQHGYKFTGTRNSDGEIESIAISGTGTQANAFRNLNYIANQYKVPEGTFAFYGYTDDEAVIIPMSSNKIFSNKEDNQGTTATPAWHTYTIDLNIAGSASWVRIQVGRHAATEKTINTVIKPMMCFPDNIGCEFEPYKGEKLSIAFPSEAGTVYGGYVDITQGILVQEWIYKTLSDFSVSLTSNSETAWTNWRARNNNNPGLINFSESVCPVVCDKFIATPLVGGLLTQNQSLPIVWMSAVDGTLRFKSQEYCTLTAAEFKETFADMKVCYKLRNPIHYSLTPQTLKTLRGTNNIWSNSNGDITVQFWRH